MNHHLAKTYRKRRLTFFFIVLFIVFFILLQNGFLKKIHPFFTHIITPIWQAENFTKDFLSLTFSSKKDLYKQNILLKEEIEKKDLELLITKTIEEENLKLKEILGRTPSEKKVVLSAILAKPNQTPYDTLIIDRGSKDGVSPDDLVFIKGDVLIGEIESVDLNSSRVLMYSTPGNILQVVYGNTGIYFNAKGLGNGSFEVDVTRDIEVYIGDMFFYPGLDNTLIGTVKKIDFDPRDSFKKVLMKSPVNIQEERWVEVRIN